VPRRAAPRQANGQPPQKKTPPLGPWFPSKQDGQKLPTLLGDPIAADRSVPGLIHLVGGTPLNVVTLLGYQGVATGGVVIVVDQVLLPAAVIAANAPLTPVFTPALGLGRR
jgi:hypothetical protein